MVYMSPRAHAEAFFIMFIFVGAIMSTWVLIQKYVLHEPVSALTFTPPGGAIAIGIIGLTAMALHDLHQNRVYDRKTRTAGDNRQLRSINQAVTYLDLTNRLDIPDADRAVLVGHDLPILAAMANVTIPQMDRDPNLLVDWVTADQPVHLYALALRAAIEDTDLRAHLDGTQPLDETLLEQRAANIHAAAGPNPIWDQPE